MQVSSKKTIYLIGNVFTQRAEETKTIIISQGKIRQILDGKRLPDGQENTVFIELEPDVVVFPALINLHTHIGYNILPIWQSNQVWKNRFQWRNSPTYNREIKGLIEYIKVNWKKDNESFFSDKLSQNIISKVLKRNFELFKISDEIFMLAISEIEKAHAITSEIQAVAGGISLIQQTLNLEDEEPNNRTFIIRNTGSQGDLGIPIDQRINSIVDFFKPDIQPSGSPDEDTSNWNPVLQNSYKDFIDSVNSGNSKFYSTLIHIGEGKAGFLPKSQKDIYSNKEIIELLKSLQKDLLYPENLKKSNLSLTHANGINSNDPGTLKYLRENQISIIWSPLSNMLLYFDTLEIKKFLDQGINVCLGSDWSPSGSKHALDEMKFAKFLSDKLKWHLSDEALFEMVTINPSKALGSEASGLIKQGGNADLFVLRKNDLKKSSLSNLLSSDDNWLEFVMVNGRIIFGLKSYFEKLNVDFETFPESEGENIIQRDLSLNKNLDFNLRESLKLMDVLIERYCSTVMNDSSLNRTKFFSSDDKIYRDNIFYLKTKISNHFNN